MHKADVFNKCAAALLAALCAVSMAACGKADAPTPTAPVGTVAPTAAPETPQPTESQPSFTFAPDTVVLAASDLDRDGEDEFVVAEGKAETGGYITLRVLDTDGTSLWERTASDAHVGWTELFLYTDETGDYLLSYDPWMGQGNAIYKYTLFTLEGGTETVCGEGSVEYDINGDALLPVADMLAFADGVNALIKKSTVLLASGYTSDGGYEYGPADAEPYLETYSWLDIYGAGIFESGDTLADKLQKYSDWAVSARVNN